MAELTPSTIRIGRRYRPSRLNGPYDALVIGSGIGGLTTAALLSPRGSRAPGLAPSRFCEMRGLPQPLDITVRVEAKVSGCP